MSSSLEQCAGRAKRRRFCLEFRVYAALTGGMASPPKGGTPNAKPKAPFPTCRDSAGALQIYIHQAKIDNPKSAMSKG
jgi:hypothetical protein